MDLPVNDQELDVIIESISNVDTELYRKLRLVKDVRDANPDAPYKKILRDTYGMLI